MGNEEFGFDTSVYEHVLSASVTSFSVTYMLDPVLSPGVGYDHMQIHLPYHEGKSITGGTRAGTWSTPLANGRSDCGPAEVGILGNRLVKPILIIKMSQSNRELVVDFLSYKLSQKGFSWSQFNDVEEN
ncbi:hypothetical protein ABFV05_005317 [Capra hircus]